jgi:hypothetical protein
MNFKDITLADISTETKVETLGIVLDKKLEELSSAVYSVAKEKGEQGDKGEKGDKGDKGEQGVPGKDSKDGINGKDGKDGVDGKDGEDGLEAPKIIDAEVALDDTLLLTLSDGTEIKTTKTIVGQRGLGGANGSKGDKGDTGLGLITGGTTGQYLRKASSTDYDTSWGTLSTVATSGAYSDLSGTPALGTIATQNANAVAITGGTINGTTIGATSATTVNATTITGQTARVNGTGQNFLLQSQFASDWTATRASTSINSAVAPDSTSTALTLTSDGTSGTHFIQPASAATTPAGQTRTLSVFAKAGTNNFIQVAFGGDATPFANFNLSVGTVGSSASVTASIVSFGNGWYRCIATATSTSATDARFFIITSGTSVRGESNSLATTVLLWGAQLEFAASANTYIPTTSAAVYGTPTLSFSGVSEIGLLSTGALYLQPAGTGAIQAQATTSTTAGGNARGSWSVDWQLTRASAAQVASGVVAVVAGGGQNTASNTYATVSGGQANTASNLHSVISGGLLNTASGIYAGIVAGNSNTASGYYGFVGNGFTNSTTSNSAVTTQSGTMNATTAVTLSGSNANIKVGQYISGTSIASDTYVAAISGTALTLSKVASGSSTSTLSFFTPHGVVVGGGNNQATGAYSAILGGGDAGSASQRNVASGDWSVVCGGTRNTASGLGSFIGGGGTFAPFGTFPHTASGVCASIVGGFQNTASGQGAFVGSGYLNTANGQFSAIMGGQAGTTRSISGNHVFPACAEPISASVGASQAALLVLGVQTTDATATALRSNTSAAGTGNQVILPNNSAYFFRGEVISGKTAGGDTKGWTIEGVIKRGANAASTALVGTPTVTSMYADVGAATWAIAVTADTTNGGLRVTFTGQAATTIRTVCQIRTTEMTY